MSLLELTDASFRHDGAEADALRGMNIGFDCGKVYAVLGKPGSGKTTLLLLLAGLELCGGGEIRFDGQSMRNIDRDEYRAKNVGAVFRSCNLIPGATALENVTLAMDIGLGRSPANPDKAYALLRECGLEREAAGRKACRLTEPARRRAALARAMACSPRVLLADEPTFGLDPSEEEAMLRLLASEAHEHGMCVITATQSKKVASASDELWALADGRLLFVR